jgi:hypothetical protein
MIAKALFVRSFLLAIVYVCGGKKKNSIFIPKSFFFLSPRKYLVLVLSRKTASSGYRQIS